MRSKQNLAVLMRDKYKPCNYQRVILWHFRSFKLSRIDNLEKSYTLKAKQVAALDKSIVAVSNDLFKSARVGISKFNDSKRCFRD
jgi:hypothetical protein